MPGNKDVDETLKNYRVRVWGSYIPVGTGIAQCGDVKNVWSQFSQKAEGTQVLQFV